MATLNCSFQVDLSIDFDQNSRLLKELRKFTLDTFLGVDSEADLDERWKDPKAFQEDALAFISDRHMPMIVHYDYSGKNPVVRVPIEGGGVTLEMVEELIDPACPVAEMYV